MLPLATYRSSGLAAVWGRNSRRAMALFIKMDAAVKAKVEKLFGNR